MNDVMNGSATPNVTGLPWNRSGSGLFSQCSRWARNAYVTANARATAISEMTSRERNSPRCSTSVASSSWRRRRGSRFIDGTLRNGRVVLARGGQFRAYLVRLLVLAGDRLLELPHSLPQRAADLGHALGAEDEEDHDEEEDDLRNTDPARHGTQGSAFETRPAVRGTCRGPEEAPL